MVLVTENGPVIIKQPTTSHHDNSESTSPSDCGTSKYCLEIFDGVNEFIIQQTTTEDESPLSSENRYTVKVSKSSTIAYATETSESYQRFCFGSSRAFRMRLYDTSQKEVLLLERRLACGYCPFCCFLQKMDVLISPGQRVGKVCQSYSINLKTEFRVFDEENSEIFSIVGPSSFGGLLGKSQHFQIFGIGTATTGSIVYQWDQQSSNHITLQIPDRIENSHHKALLLGSAFLIDYMYFESLRSKSCRRCFC